MSKTPAREQQPIWPEVSMTSQRGWLVRYPIDPARYAKAILDSDYFELKILPNGTLVVEGDTEGAVFRVIRLGEQLSLQRTFNSTTLLCEHYADCMSMLRQQQHSNPVGVRFIAAQPGEFHFGVRETMFRELRRITTLAGWIEWGRKHGKNQAEG